MATIGFGQQGWNQQTPAVQTMIAQAFGTAKRATSTKRRKKATKKAAPRRKASAKRKAKPARLVKGSAAAKRYMASIRKKRRK